MSTKLIFSLLITLSFLSCEHDLTDNLQHAATIDPHSSTLWNKDVKYMIEKNANGSNDTIAFDRDGNKAFRHTLTEIEHFEFNKDRLITRFFSKIHVKANFKVDYSFKGNSIIQIWNEIPGREWLVSKNKIDSAIYSYRIIFKLDDVGRISSEIDSMRNRITRYHYLDNILEKETTSLSGNDLLSKEIFYYKESRLIKFERYSRELLNYTYYYSETTGLPTFRRRSLKGFPDYDVDFEYIFY